MEKRITKAQARKRFEAGKTIYLQSSNMRFKSMWSSAIPVKKDQEEEESRQQLIKSITAQGIPPRPGDGCLIPQFDKIVNEFEYYNCCNERGKYAHFYTLENE